MSDFLSPILGQHCQLGFVVRDLEASALHFSQVLGAGPFLIFDKGTGRPAPITYYRRSETQVETRLAFGFLGDVQIELIQQVNDAPSPYKDFLDAGHEGLQHFGFWVPDHPNVVSQLSTSGYQLDYRIPIAGQRDEILYYRAPSFVGPMVELVPTIWRRSRAAVKARLGSWQGGDPLIPFQTYGAFWPRWVSVSTNSTGSAT